MRSTALTSLAGLLLAVLAAPAPGQLVNGGAETGALAPWVPDLSGATTGNPSIIKAVTSQVQTDPPVFPWAGGWFFSFATQTAGAPGAFVRMAQTVDLAAPPAELALTGRLQTEFGDFGEARLEMLGAGGALLATESLGALVSDNVWSSFYLDAGVPPGTLQCRVRLTGTVQTGMAVNVFWDSLALGPSPWTIVGSGLAGAAGVPQIDGDGPLAGGEPVSLSLDDAKPLATAYLVVGLSGLLAPFKGGVLVPNPDLLLPLPTGPGGQVLLVTTWPAGLPSGLPVWFQWWIPDAAGPAGFAASAGLRGTTP
jgi:hypothetical protein